MYRFRLTSDKGRYSRVHSVKYGKSRRNTLTLPDYDVNGTYTIDKGCILREQSEHVEAAGTKIIVLLHNAGPGSNAQSVRDCHV